MIHRPIDTIIALDDNTIKLKQTTEQISSKITLKSLFFELNTK